MMISRELQYLGHDRQTNSVICTAGHKHILFRRGCVWDLRLLQLGRGDALHAGLPVLALHEEHRGGQQAQLVDAHHGVQDVAPAGPEAVAVPVGQQKH
eukprot:scaffold465640_cov48-Prasinocladus_malaysianus.AAC.1